MSLPLFCFKYSPWMPDLGISTSTSAMFGLANHDFDEGVKLFGSPLSSY